MSEKYSTDELVEALEAYGIANAIIKQEEILAIIARLRAADNLKNKSLMKLASDLGVAFSAAKILEDHVRTEYDARLRAADRLVSVVKETLNRPTSYVDTRNIDKAIAEYEGKK
jgi:hypothetical protein